MKLLEPSSLLKASSKTSTFNSLASVLSFWFDKESGFSDALDSFLFRKSFSSSSKSRKLTSSSILRSNLYLDPLMGGFFFFDELDFYFIFEFELLRFEELETGFIFDFAFGFVFEWSSLLRLDRFNYWCELKSCWLLLLAKLMSLLSFLRLLSIPN